MYAAFEQLEQVTFWGMVTFDPDMNSVSKLTMFAIERVVVVD